MSGLRRDEAATRGQAPIVARDLRGLVKVNPLATWTDRGRRGLHRRPRRPVNPLKQQGYLSIGCLPCTQLPTDPNDPARAAGPGRARRSAASTTERSLVGWRDEVRHLLRAPAAPAVGGGRRAPAAQGRARAGGAGRRLGFDYVWEVEHHFLEEYSHSSRARGVPRRRQPAHQPHPPRPRHRAAAPRLQPPRPGRRADRHARPDHRRPGRLRHRRVVVRGRARRLRHRPRPPSASSGTRRSTPSPACSSRSPSPATTAPSSRCRPATSCPSRSRSRTRRCGSPARAGRPSTWPPRRASARCRSASSSRPRQRPGWTTTTPPSPPRRACPAASRSTRNLAIVLPFMCHEDEATAIDRGLDGGHFFGYSLGHYYVFGEPHARPHRRVGRVPGAPLHVRLRPQRRSQTGEPLGAKLSSRASALCAAPSARRTRSATLLRGYEEAGVDQVIFVSQAGNNRHEHICESLELFARKVMPEFPDGEDARQKAKLERLAPAMEAALARARRRGRRIRPTRSRPARCPEGYAR